MTTPEVGGARVRIAPDLTGFPEQLRRDLRIATANLGKAAQIKISPDFTGFLAQLKQDLRAATSEVGNAAKIRITPDFTGFAAQMKRDLRAATSGVGTAGRIRLTPDFTGFSAQLKRDLRAVTSGIGTAGRVRLTPDLTGFLSQLKRDVRAATANLGTAARVRVTPNLTGFATTLRREIRDAIIAASLTARIRVVPDLTGFATILRREVRNVLAGIGPIKVRVVPDLTGFASTIRNEINRATNGVNGRVGIHADVAGFSSSLGGLGGIIGGITSALGAVGSALGGISSAAISAIGYAATTATAAVLGLAASLSKVGLEQANILQTGSISFDALAYQITGTTQAVNGLGDAQRQAIGDEFLESLREISLETSISLQGMIANSQALLALGFSGEQAKNTILTVGNALAASGKSGAQLNMDLKGVITAFSQISGAGRLLAQDLNQITTRIPAAARGLIQEELAENLGLIADKAKASETELIKARQAIIKMSEAGEISSELAIGAILRVLQEIPGAVDEATMEASALKRVNEQTLGGAFEEVADRFRQSLGDAFKTSADEIAPQLSAFGKRIEPLVQNFVGPLTTIVTSVVDILDQNAEAISEGIGAAFQALADVLVYLAPKIPGIIVSIRDMFGTLRDKITEIIISVKDFKDSLSEFTGPIPNVITVIGNLWTSIGDLQTRFADFSIPSEILAVGGLAALFVSPVAGISLLAGALASTPGAIDNLKEAFKDLEPVVDPILSIIESIGQILLSLTPVILGMAEGVAALAPVMEVLATAFGAVADVLAGTLNSDFGEFLGFVAVLGGTAALAITTLAKWPALFWAINAVIVTLRTSFITLTAAMAANPLGAAIVAIALLTAAFVYGWQHSETFREIVVNAFYFIAKVVTTQVDILLGLFEKLLSGLDNITSHIPLIGDKLGSQFDKASDAVRTLRGNIDDMTESIKNIPTASKIKAVDQGVGQYGPFIPVKAVNQGVGQYGPFIPGDPNDPKNKKKKAADPKYPSLFSPTVDLGLQNALNALREQERLAKEREAERVRAAKAAADAILRAIKASLEAAANIRKKIEKKSLDQIEDQFDTLYEHLFAANKTMLVKIAFQAEQQLWALAQQRDAIQETLKDASSALETLQGDAVRFKETIFNSVIELGNVTEKPEGLRATIHGITNNLSRAITEAKLFGSTIKDLQNLGLNQVSLRQLIDAGPEGGTAAAVAIKKAGSEGVKRVNDLQKELTDAAGNISTTVSDHFYKAGIKAAQGLVDGLKSQEAAIEAQMIKIADKMVATLQKGLQIHSPSMRMYTQVGVPSGKGAINGMVDTLNKARSSSVSESMVKYAQSINIGPISVEGGSDRESAATAGTMLGTYASEVLERRGLARSVRVGA